MSQLLSVRATIRPLQKRLSKRGMRLLLLWGRMRRHLPGPRCFCDLRERQAYLREFERRKVRCRYLEHGPWRF